MQSASASPGIAIAPRSVETFPGEQGAGSSLEHDGFSDTFPEETCRFKGGAPAKRKSREKAAAYG